MKHISNLTALSLLTVMALSSCGRDIPATVTLEATAASQELRLRVVAQADVEVGEVEILENGEPLRLVGLVTLPDATGKRPTERYRGTIRIRPTQGTVYTAVARTRDGARVLATTSLPVSP